MCAYVIRCFVEEITVGENWEMIFCCWSMVLVKPKSMLLIGWVLSIHRIKWSSDIKRIWYRGWRHEEFGASIVINNYVNCYLKPDNIMMVANFGSGDFMLPLSPSFKVLKPYMVVDWYWCRIANLCRRVSKKISPEDAIMGYVSRKSERLKKLLSYLIFDTNSSGTIDAKELNVVNEGDSWRRMIEVSIKLRDLDSW